MCLLLFVMCTYVFDWFRKFKYPAKNWGTSSIQTLFDIFFICQKSKTWYASSILVQVIAIVILKIEIDKRR